MFKLIFTWLIFILILNLLLRFIFRMNHGSSRMFHPINYYGASDYDKGYMTGITNLKMYYYSVGDIPSSHWLDANKFNLLDSREKLDKTLMDKIK